MIRRVASRVASVEEERGTEQDHYTWESSITRFDPISRLI